MAIPALPGCTSQGDTREEALSMIREAIEVYIESLVARGDPIPGNYKPFPGTSKLQALPL